MDTFPGSQDGRWTPGLDARPSGPFAQRCLYSVPRIETLVFSTSDTNSLWLWVPVLR